MNVKLSNTIRALLVSLAISVALHAQQYVFRAYRQAEGLKNLAVNAMATDRDGFLWVATENGVYRFLGSSFQRFGPEQGITEVDVHEVVADPTGAVWVGTEEHVYRWDGQRFSPIGKIPIHVLGRQRMAVEDQSHLLVVDKDRLYRLEHDAAGHVLSYLPVISDSVIAFTPALGQVSSVSVVPDPAHGLRIWIGGGKELYSLVDRPAGGAIQPGDNAVTKWGTDNGLPTDNWEGVLLDRTGTLWAGGERRVAVLPRGGSRFVDRDIPGSDPENVAGHAPLIEDREGRILAPAQTGIARWNGTAWRIVGRANGLERTSHIAGMTIDAAGDLLIASRGQGIYDWAGYEDWEGWSDRQGLPSATVWSIVPSREGRVLLGTEGGPAWVDPGSGSSGPLSAGARWTYGELATMFLDRRGMIYGGTFSGAIVRIDPKTGSTRQMAKLPAFIMKSLVDSTGRVFFATKQGMYVLDAGVPSDRSSSLGWKAGAPGDRSSSAERRYSGTGFLPHRVAAVDALLGQPNRVEAGCEAPGGVLWFLANNRLLRLQDGQWTEPSIDGLPRLSGSLLDLSCAPDGAVWVTGEQAGTWRLTTGSDRLQASQLVLPAELRSLTPLAILVDRNGWVWLGTDLGLVAWNGRSWRHLSQESGLLWNDIDQGALLAGPDGSLWVGTSGGLSHLIHPERVFEPTPLAVSITSIRRGNNVYTTAEPITLPWAALPLRFQISSPAMRNRSELLFKYRIEELQTGWIESQDGLAVFSALPPGNYTFEAMVHNPSLSAYSAVVGVSVRILPPWWRSNWFLVLSSLVILLLLAAVGWLYARHLKKTSRQLERMVQERTRELEASREQLRIQATHDGLTGMLNRTAILRALTAEMDRARRENRTVVVALVDLDHFKRVNDAYGHMAGDEALRWFSAAVGTAIRPYDHAGRYGGEEFLLVLTEIPPESVCQRLTVLHSAISNLQIRTRDFDFSIACSMGATVFNPSAGPGSVESLLAIADAAMYTAKAEGRNRVILQLGDARVQPTHHNPASQLSPTK
jgi:diguanylate cyclase (GGDEF)-like protein